MINLIGGILLLTVTCLCGLVAFAKYHECDILSTKKISRGEQVNLTFGIFLTTILLFFFISKKLLPYLVMDILGELPGLPGLFVATIYSAALRYLLRYWV